MSRTIQSRKIAVVGLLLLLVGVLTGCMPPNEDGTSTEDLLNEGIWSRYFVYPLSWSLDFFAETLWGEYGLAILVLTIIIRLIVLPLTLKQYRSSKAMQALQPEIQKLRDKYKDNPQKMQEETMKLFQKNGVNPLAGCFPILVQMPILIALYNAIYWNADIRTHTFLIFELGEKDPYFILPTLAAITTYIQQKMMMKHTSTPSQMKALLIIFPVLIFVMSMQFASALPLYWVFSNLFTIGQTYFIYGRSSETKGGLSK